MPSFPIMDDEVCKVFKKAMFRPNFYVDLVSVKAKMISVTVDTYRFPDLTSSTKPLPYRFTMNL